MEFEKVNGADLVRLWIGPARGAYEDEREPDHVVPLADVDRFVIEWLRGPHGPAGPTGPMGAAAVPEGLWKP